MKKLFFFLSLFASLASWGQVYNPALSTVTNKALGVAQAAPTDARTYFYDANNFRYRAYVDTGEVKSYLTLAKYRTGQFDIVVNSGGTLGVDGIIIGGTNAIWYFKDSTGGDNLVPKIVASNVYTGSNGITLSSFNFKLGGALLENTTWTSANASWRLNLTGVNTSTSNGLFSVTNNSTGYGLNVTGTTGFSIVANATTGRAFNGIATTGRGVMGSATAGVGVYGLDNSSGYGLFGTTISGVGVYGISNTGLAAELSVQPVNGNAVVPVAKFVSISQGVGSAGSGASLDMWVKTDATVRKTGRIISVLTNAADASRSADFEFWNTNNAVEARKFKIAASGQLTADGYGVGTFPGTVAKYAAWNSAGNMIEVDPSSIGSGTVTSVSVVTANMFSGSVATATTTPAITLTLDSSTLHAALWTALNARARLSVANTFTADNTFSANILMPATTSSSVGVLLKNGVRFLHNWTDPDIIADGDNTFLGTLAGNFTMGDAGGGGAIGGRNTAVGYKALTANTTGWQNTAIGHISQQSNTTGLYNTSVGAYSLAVNTTGDNNTAVGSDAMWLNTTGQCNSSFGTYGLQQNTTGSNNTAFGFKALFANTTGSNNIAIGSEALSAATTFGYNIAIGTQAMKNSNAISNNVAVGAFSMFAVQGAGNTALGIFGMQSITTGANNTGIGYGANSTATSGDGGVYVGSESAWNVTTGGRNVFLGYRSGYNADTENDNVMIGYDQRLKFDAEDGQLNIQSIIFGRGNTGNNATLSTGKIGIGVADPQAKLHVLSTTEQARWGYDASNYASVTVGSTGSVVNDLTGTSPTYRFNKSLGIGTAPSAFLHVLGTTEQVRIGYDASNYETKTVSSTGSVTYDLTGTSPLFTFSKGIIGSTFYSNATSTSANFAVVSGNGIATTTNANIIFGGASQIKSRVWHAGGSGTLATNDSYGGSIWGTQAVAGAASGTHAWGASAVFKPFTFTNNGAAMTNAATVYIDGAPTTASTNYSLYIPSGNSRIDGFIYFNGGMSSSATTTNANMYLASGSAATTAFSTSQLLYGGASAVAFRISERGSTSTTMAVNDSYGAHIIGDQGITEAASGTHAWVSGLVVKSPTITGGGATTTNMATAYFDWVTDADATNNYGIYSVGKLGFDATITAGGTTGNQTINKPTGTVNIAAAGATVTVTNSLVTTSSIVYAVIRTNDATATGIKNVVCSSGSFVITLNAAATAETSIGFIVFD